MQYLKTNSRLSSLEGGGEMGKRIQMYNWNDTAVGNPDKWSQSLYTTLSIIINSKFPMFLWWGKELTQFYNDAYRPSLGDNGKHPKALGQIGQDCWQEIWPTIKPLIDQVLAGGESIWRENQLIPIYRNGKIEDVYWTFSYSPVNDESGKVGGVLVVCDETTKKVNSVKIIKDKEQLFRNIFMEAPVAVAIMKGEKLFVDFANKKVLEYWDRTLDQVINKPLFEALPEAAGQGLEALLSDVYTTGERFAAQELSVDLFRNGKLEKTYINFVYEPYYDLAGKITGIIVLANEITDQVLAIKKIEEAEERARVAIESAELGCYEIILSTGEMITDTVFNTVLDMAYPAAYADFLSTMHPGDRFDWDAAYAEALLTGHIKCEIRFIPKNMNVHWVKVTGKVVYDQAGNPEKMAGIVQDITIQKELDRHKDDFISMVSHELKTPLTSLKAYSSILMEKLGLLKDEQSTALLTRMDKQLNRLNYIIQDLADVTRVENSQLKFREDEFDFNEFLSGIVEEVQNTTKSHKIFFHLTDAATIMADKERISQVVTNLLINAIKYSPTATAVNVATYLRNDEIICSIKDFGSRVPKDKQAKIFEKFYQVSESGKSNSGFGLGLYISSQIVKRQNGRMWVDSDLGKGSTFSFSLPAKKINRVS